jgi:hypothetical protein
MINKPVHPPLVQPIVTPSTRKCIALEGLRNAHPVALWCPPIQLQDKQEINGEIRFSHLHDFSGNNHHMLQQVSSSQAVMNSEGRAYFDGTKYYDIAKPLTIRNYITAVLVATTTHTTNFNQWIFDIEYIRFILGHQVSFNDIPSLGHYTDATNWQKFTMEASYYWGIAGDSFGGNMRIGAKYDEADRWCWVGTLSFLALFDRQIDGPEMQTIRNNVDVLIE